MKRFNNSVLLVILMVLLGGFVLTRLLHAPALERNLEENLLKFDTSKITEIRISPAIEKKGEIKLVRSSNVWRVQRNNRVASADSRLLKNVLGSIKEIHPDRVVSRKKEKWGDYNVDTTGTNIKVYTGNEMQAEFWVGETSSGTSCVRVEGEDDVYAVKETVADQFNKAFNAWRDKSFLRVQPDMISKINFQYPADSSFTLTRVQNEWKISDLKVDSSKVQNYLNKLKSRTIAEFADNFTTQSLPTYVVTMGTDATTLVTVQCWKVQDDKWVLTSNLQDNVYFSAHGQSLIADLFVGKKSFTTK